MRSTAKVVTWALLAIVALAVLVFCVSNRQPVTVSLYPLPYTVTELPLFLWMFGMVILGGLFGMIVAWVAGHDGRKLSAERRRRIKELEKQLAERPVPVRHEVLEHKDSPALPSSRDAA
ncbi:MAG: LapA family protein [Proteobacteria bacterium]|nr:LapA family protein [Pseudomonadota bacterium]MDA0951570.1 LapA family protein [Pseudomonadota bacterium]